MAKFFCGVSLTFVIRSCSCVVMRKNSCVISQRTYRTPYLNLFIPLSFSAVSPKCVHNGKEFSEGEVYRMDPCWLCQCRGGISFCSKAECAELDCENFYIPEGECCPVCIGTHTCHLFTVMARDTAAYATFDLAQHCTVKNTILKDYGSDVVA